MESQMSRVGPRFMRSLLVPTVVIAALFTMVLIGCEKEPTGPSDDDIRAAQQLVDEGFALLGAAIDSVDQELTVMPDFLTPKGKFEEALELDPDNHDAKVGLALCELMIAAENPALWSVIGGFIPTGPIGKAAAGGRIPFARVLGGTKGTGSELLSPGGLLTYMHGQMAKMAQDTPPNLEPLQSAVEIVILPVLETVTDLLEAVEADAEWYMVLTPEMFGFEDAEGQLEIDVTDIYMLDALVSVLKAQLYFFVSYNLNFPAADTTSIKAALNQTDGTLLKLRTNGAASMGNVLTSIMAAITKAGQFKASLEGETDDQTDDLIKIDPSGEQGPPPEDLEEIEQNLTDLVSVLSGPTDVEEDFDGDGTKETLSVDLSSFFTSPIQDPKQLLPPYHWNSMYATFLWDGWPEDFSLFVFPDPTMSGVFPDMTSNALFLDFFGITMWPSYGPFPFDEGGGGGN